MISVFCSQRYANRSKGHTGGWRESPCWAYSVPWPSRPKFYTNIEEFINDSAPFKVAFYLVDWGLDYDSQSGQSVYERERTNICNLSQAGNLVFVIEHEVHYPCLAETNNFRDLSNVYWIMAGTADTYRDRIIPWQYHLWRIRDLYEELPTHLLKLSPYSVKPYYFDAMLGTQKGPRPLVFDWIHQHGLQDQILASIGPNPGKPMDQSMLSNSEFFVDPEWKPVSYCDYLHLNQHVLIDDRVVQMPCLMPLNLYNRTAYSIICETGFANGTHMITEKTAKVLIARRMFVMFAGAGFLRYMKEQGFRTFEGILDESYDTEIDDKKRWHRAFEQVQRLCSLDQEWVLSRARPILEHNYLQVMARDLTQQPFDYIQRLILQYASTKI